MARVVVAGLGPADRDLLTVATRDALASATHVFIRTRRHPAASAVPENAVSFDDVYDTEATLDAVYTRIVDALVAAAHEHGEVVYLVPGSPLVAERTVELLRAADVQLEVLPALSFVDLAWDRLGVDPLTAGVRLVDGRQFAVDAAGERGPLLVAQCDSRAVLSDVKLATDAGSLPAVTVLQRLGLPDEAVFEVAWDDLDGAFEPDHLTSLYIPALAAPIAGEVARFAELVRTLRERCPWDREQTHQSLTRHLLEETYEVLEAIEAIDVETGEGDDHLEEELGDLLFQVVFHTTLATERGAFTLADVARGIHDKLVHRHPHVFGDLSADSADEVMGRWEELKRQEKGRESVFDGIPGSLPALLYALKIQRKAASIGLDVAAPEGALATDPEVGDALYALVAAARGAGVDPEAALRASAARHLAAYRDAER